ncbi:ABC transporter family substrate-binding protein [Haloglycomyces albus]|uniref:ABC transporter family substrate-binding protein n=1 Tax=Haloglycomyces albus TaxID=526067 RepID=UPI0004BB201A|nr:ABC transporter family substrate-binding protein [Haloglycomyces albus]
MKTSAKSAVAVGAVGMMLLAACGSDDGENGAANVGGLEDCKEHPNECNSGDRKDGGEAVVAIPQAWEGWYERRAGSGSVYNMYATSGIIPQVQDGGYQPDQTYEYNQDVFAEEPERLNEDDEPLKVRYEFKETAVWDTGEQIGSLDDFLFYWYSSTTDTDLCADQEKCDPRGTSYGDKVESIEEVDGGIEITYIEGYADAEWHIGAPFSVPGHAATEAGFDWKNDPEEMSDAVVWMDETIPTWSGGPYKIEPDSVEMGDAGTVTMVPNENWYGEVEPTLDKLHIEVIGEEGAALTALENGEVDAILPRFDSAFVEKVGDIPNAVSTIYEASVWEHLNFNTSNEFLADKELRRAIFNAINTQDIIDATFGPYVDDMEPRTNHIFSEKSEYHEDYLTETGSGTGDLDAAEEILKDAGYTGFGDQLMTPDGDPVEGLRLTHGANAELRAITQSTVQSTLEEMGIGAEVIADAPDAFGSNLAEGKFDITYFGWSGTPSFVGSAEFYWHSDSGGNYAGIDNPEIDEAAENSATTFDIDEAAALENEAYKLAVDEYAVLPVLTQPGIVVFNEDLVNVRPNGSNSLNSLYNIAEWGWAAE